MFKLFDHINFICTCDDFPQKNKTKLEQGDYLTNDPETSLLPLSPSHMGKIIPGYVNFQMGRRRPQEVQEVGGSSRRQ